MVFLAGAAVGFVSLGPVAAEMIWGGADGPTSTHYMIAGAAAFLVMGVLSLVLFKPIISVATSMFGSTLVVSSAVHLMETFSPGHQGLYQSHPRELAWLFAGVVVAGVMFQALTRKKRKTSD
jgi:peptidoglycan/LPS O-acetylase OafA/YrhL